jgi:hypothetical protein
MNKLQATFFLGVVTLFPVPAAQAQEGGQLSAPVFAQGIVMGIDNGDRVRIQDFLRMEHEKNCPPGLAKKSNGCLPPGQSKKYKVGSVYEGSWSSIPDELAGMLRGAPAGHRYVIVDKDIILIAEASKRVIDAVTLLSAVGR